MFKDKYLKYKKKYLDLTKLENNRLLGGSDEKIPYYGNSDAQSNKQLPKSEPEQSDAKTTSAPKNETSNVHKKKSQDILQELSNKHSNAKAVYEDALFGAAKFTGLLTAGLAATGVGVPFAGTLTAVLILGKQIAILAKNFKKLQNVMYDVINILVYNFKLYNLIVKSKETMAKWLHMDSDNKKKIFEGGASMLNTFSSGITNAKAAISKRGSELYKRGSNQLAKKSESLKKMISNDYDEVDKITEDEFKDKTSSSIEKKIMFKLNSLINYILKILHYDILKSLIESTDMLQIPSMFKMIEYEMARRDKSTFGILKGHHFVQDKLITFSNIMDGQTITVNIISDLSIINGYFIIYKSKYDYLERVFQTTKAHIWPSLFADICKLPEYIEFMEEAHDLSAFLENLPIKTKQELEDPHLVKVEQEDTDKPDDTGQPVQTGTDPLV